MDDGQNRRPDFRVDESLLLEPDQALDVGAGVTASLAARGEASGVVCAVERAGHPVNPAEAEGLLHGVVVGDALLARIYRGEDEPYFRLRLEVLGEPLAPLGAAVSAECLHNDRKSATSYFAFLVSLMIWLISSKDKSCNPAAAASFCILRNASKACKRVSCSEGIRISNGILRSRTTVFIKIVKAAVLLSPNSSHI